MRTVACMHVADQAKPQLGTPAALNRGDHAVRYQPLPQSGSVFKTRQNGSKALREVYVKSEP
jgi:hypothetical protein